jgi:hypothetical protein
VFGDPVSVQVFTLDELIGEYGTPAFVKVDVEGYEAEVLAGLTSPVAGLSFEVHAADPGKATSCIEMLSELGRYRYSYSRLETFELEAWPTCDLAMFGDVYAVLERD